jgi:thiamine biosynthesis lipoprotein
MRLNRHAVGDPFQVSPETAAVLVTAERVSVLSDGAFDVTVAPLVDAWGFGARPRLPATPSAAQIEAARASVGFRQLALDPARLTVTRLRTGTSCDLSAIAPGYAADRVSAALAALGHGDLLVDIGGEIKVLGRRPGAKPWRVGVATARPTSTTDDPASTDLSTVVDLRDDLALATSGDYRNFVSDAGGRRRPHVIDPRTGRPVSHGLASVTVVARTAAEADALATALLVLGPVDGQALAEREQLAAHFIIRRGPNEFETRDTASFAALRAR